MYRTSFCALATLLLLGCGNDAGTADADAGADALDEICTATFSWWQKDAYLDAAGRSTGLWPPHTTTTLTVACGAPGEVALPVAGAEMVNHGTSTTAATDEGAQILALMRAETTTGARDELLGLVAAYEQCECGTTFLSMDTLSDDAVMELVTELATYLTANMTCPEEDGGVDQLVADLEAGDIAAVLSMVPDCSFTAGSWQEGLDAALTAVIAASSDVLADYHVCNNDALLQAGLWDGFLASGVSGSCDTTASLCAGPAWYLACDEQDRAECVP